MHKAFVPWKINPGMFIAPASAGCNYSNALSHSKNSKTDRQLLKLSSFFVFCFAYIVETVVFWDFGDFLRLDVVGKSLGGFLSTIL